MTGDVGPSPWRPNITVEDPTKHLRHASFLGMHDSVQGSSANVLTGGSVVFGTSGFGLLVDTDQLVRSVP